MTGTVPPRSNNWNRKNPFPSRLLRNVNLSGRGSAKEVRHLEFSLAESGIDFKVGDSLAVCPTNAPEEVEELLHLGEFGGDEGITLRAGEFTLREALSQRLDIHTVTRKLRRRLGETWIEAEPLATDAGKGWLDGRHVVDVLTEFPAPMDPQAFADTLRGLTPRLYSVASSLKAHRDICHVTVSAVRYETHGRARRGVASVYMAERLPEGAVAPVYIQPSQHFHLPEDGDAAMIMVGPGTGIAPFRAFLQEREVLGHTGRNWLYFGDQHEATDFLYGDEFAAMGERGLLTRLDTAWSRDQAHKVYVQDKMREAAEEMWRWIDAGAYFFVCGDAQRMAPDVDEALRDIVAGQGGMTAEAAAAYLKEMSAAGRYQKDVY